MSSGIVLLIVVAVILVIVAYLVGILIRKRNDSGGLHSLKNASKNCLTCQLTKKLKKLKIFI